MRLKIVFCVLVLAVLVMPGAVAKHVSLDGRTPGEYSNRATISFNIDEYKRISDGVFDLSPICSANNQIFLDGAHLTFSGSNPSSCSFSGYTKRCGGTKLPISGTLEMWYDPYWGLVVLLTDTGMNKKEWDFPTGSNPL
jgi:hypothetical protein